MDGLRDLVATLTHHSQEGMGMGIGLTGLGREEVVSSSSTARIGLNDTQ